TTTPSVDIYLLSLHDALPICSERIAVLGERFFLREFAHSKVEHLHSAALTEKDVPRLEIAMNNSEAMRGRQSAAGLHEDGDRDRSEEHTSELQSREKLVCRPL